MPRLFICCDGLDTENPPDFVIGDLDPRGWIKGKPIAAWEGNFAADKGWPLSKDGREFQYHVTICGREGASDIFHSFSWFPTLGKENAPAAALLMWMQQSVFDKHAPLEKAIPELQLGLDVLGIGFTQGPGI